MITQAEFIDKQVAIWGEDYVFDLYDRGYVPTLTSDGWKFVIVSDAEFAERQRIDNYPKLSYAS